MRENFDRCLEMLLVHEGGYVDHPRDPGGATNLGITIGTARAHGIDVDGDGDVDKDDIRLLRREDVAPVYRRKYWDKVRADDLHSGLDWAVFDWAVNSGPRRAAKALQRAAGSPADGIVGPATLAAAAAVPARDAIARIHAERERFYRALANFDSFGRGWLRRNDETRDQALEMCA